MIILTKNSLTVKNAFRPESMSLNLSERQSTATLTVGPSAPALSVGDWLQDDTAPGKGIVWRVKTVDTAEETGTRTVQLEHIINTLRDAVMFGEVKPKDITGNKNSTTCSARKAAEYVLDKSNDWTLGVTNDYTGIQNPYSFNGESLYDALELISGSLEGCMWTYDLGSYPFKLNLMKAKDDLACEMRMSRNITTLKRTVDRSRMYTRLYPIGKNNLQISGDKPYVEKNTKTYGVICRIETDNSIDNETMLKSWAQERLNRHCEPVVTVTISGLDYSRATGEPLDKLGIGGMCRVPLPESKTTILERITRLSYSDKLNEPERVTVTLANDPVDVAKILSQQETGGRRAGRHQAQGDGEDHAWIVDTDDHVSLVAEALIGKGEGDVNWSRVSDLTVDGGGINARVTSAEGDIVKHEGRISVTEKRVGMVVKRRDDDTGDMIDAASIAVAINDDGTGTAIIDADHVKITGDTLLSGMLTVENGSLKVKKSAIFGSNVSLIGSSVDNNYVSTKRVNIQSGGDIRLVGAASGEHYDITIAKWKAVLVKATVSNNTLTLEDVEGNKVNFSKAVTLSSQWSDGELTVTAKQNNVTVATRTAKIWDLRNQDISWDTSTNIATLTIYANVDGGTGHLDTGKRLTVDASVRYTAGYADGEAAGYADGEAAGIASVTVTKVALADNYNPLGDTGTRASIFIQGTASNGATKADDNFRLAVNKYAGETKPCVNLLQGTGANTEIIGRIEIPADASTVTVTKVALADNLNPLSDNQTRASGIYIQGTASNGNYKRDDGFNMGLTTYDSGSKRCVNLIQDPGETTQCIIGRINIDSVYTAGQDSVTVDKVALADNLSPLNDTQTRASGIYIQGTASNGATKSDAGFNLGISRYAGDTKGCVNLIQDPGKPTQCIIGRIAIPDDASSVTVDKVALADNLSPLNDNQTRASGIYIQGTASNGNFKRDDGFNLGLTTYSDGTKRCVNLIQDPGETTQCIIGRINVDSVYTDGKNSVTVTKVDLADNFDPLGDTGTREGIYIQGTASNGATKSNDLFSLGLGTYTILGSLTANCVNLYKGAGTNRRILGRINTESVYTEGVNSVTVDKVMLADSLSPLNSTSVRSTIPIQGTASNGKKKSADFVLKVDKYGSNSTLNCVNLLQTGNVIGRINADSIYRAGVNSVTVTKVALADNFDYLVEGDNRTRPGINIQGTASNGATKSDALFNLAFGTFSDNGKNRKHCVNLTQGAGENLKILGRLDVESTYWRPAVADITIDTVSAAPVSGTNIQGYYKVPRELSKSGLYAPGYIFFTVHVHGQAKRYYFKIN